MGILLEVAWRKSVHMRPSSHSLAAHNGALVVAGNQSQLFRIDPESGDVLWTATVRDAYGTIAVGSGVAVCLDQAGVLSCFDLEDGTLRWSTERVSGHVSVVGSYVIVGGWRGYSFLCARDLDDGSTIWRNGSDEASGKPADLLWPIAHQSSLLVSARESRFLQRLDPMTGEVQERWELAAPIVSGDLAAVFTATPLDSTLFRVGSSSVVELSETDLVEIWRSDSNLGIYPPFRAAGILWVPTRRGVAVVDLPAKTSKWVPINEGPVQGFARAGDAAIVGSRDGSVVAIGSDGAVQSRLGIARRAAAVVEVSKELSVIAAKGEVVGVRWMVSSAAGSE